MTDASTGQRVACPICGESFDPTVAGGWCTNTDCGEWQYTEEAATDTEDVTAQSDEEGAEPDDAEAAAAGVEETDPDPSDQPDADAEPAPESGDGSAADTDAEADASNAAEDTEDTDTAEPATIDCPDCGTELDADANFCIECGTDVQDLPDTGPMTECPSCGVEVGETDSFCASCGEHLDAQREDGAAGEAEADDESGEAAASPEEGDEAESGVAEADDQAAAEAEDAVEALAADDEAGEDDQVADDPETEPVPEALVLEVRGQEIRVADGDTVGREVRAALTDAGRPEDEAVRVHREHVRFVREHDSFYVVDLGDNPTVLGGRTLQKGDREPVGPGDELELSGVATLTVRAA